MEGDNIDDVLEDLGFALEAPEYREMFYGTNKHTRSLLEASLAEQGHTNVPPLAITIMAGCVQAAARMDLSGSVADPLAATLKVLPTVAPLMLAVATDRCYGKGTYAAAMDEMLLEETERLPGGDDMASYDLDYLQIRACEVAAVAMAQYPEETEFCNLAQRILAGKLDQGQLQIARNALFVCMSLTQTDGGSATQTVQNCLQELFSLGREAGSEDDEATGIYLTRDQKILLVWVMVLLFLVMVQGADVPDDRDIFDRYPNGFGDAEMAELKAAIKAASSVSWAYDVADYVNLDSSTIVTGAIVAGGIIMTGGVGLAVYFGAYTQGILLAAALTPFGGLVGTAAGFAAPVLAAKVLPAVSFKGAMAIGLMTTAGTGTMAYQGYKTLEAAIPIKDWLENVGIFKDYVQDTIDAVADAIPQQQEASALVTDEQLAELRKTELERLRRGLGFNPSGHYIAPGTTLTALEDELSAESVAPEINVPKPPEESAKLRDQLKAEADLENEKAAEAFARERESEKESRKKADSASRAKVRTYKDTPKHDVEDKPVRMTNNNKDATGTSDTSSSSSTTTKPSASSTAAKPSTTPTTQAEPVAIKQAEPVAIKQAEEDDNEEHQSGEENEAKQQSKGDINEDQGNDEGHKDVIQASFRFSTADRLDLNVVNLDTKNPNPGKHPKIPFEVVILPEMSANGEFMYTQNRPLLPSEIARRNETSKKAQDSTAENAYYVNTVKKTTGAIDTQKYTPIGSTWRKVVYSNTEVVKDEGNNDYFMYRATKLANVLEDAKFYAKALVCDTQSSNKLMKSVLIPVTVHQLAYFTTTWRAFGEHFVPEMKNNLCLEGIAYVNIRDKLQDHVVAFGFSLCPGKGETLGLYELVGDEMAMTEVNTKYMIYNQERKPLDPVTQESMIYEFGKAFFQNILQSQAIPAEFGGKENIDNIFGTVCMRSLLPEQKDGMQWANVPAGPKSKVQQDMYLYPPYNQFRNRNSYPLREPLEITPRLQGFFNSQGRYLDTPNINRELNFDRTFDDTQLITAHPMKDRLCHHDQRVWDTLKDYNDPTNTVQVRMRKFLFVNSRAIFVHNSDIQNQIGKPGLRERNLAFDTILTYSGALPTENVPLWHNMTLDARRETIQNGTIPIFRTDANTVERWPLITQLTEAVMAHTRLLVGTNSHLLNDYDNNPFLQVDLEIRCRKVLGSLLSPREDVAVPISVMDNILMVTEPLSKHAAALAIRVLKIRPGRDITKENFQSEKEMYKAARQPFVDDFMAKGRRLVDDARKQIGKRESRAQVVARINPLNRALAVGQAVYDRTAGVAYSGAENIGGIATEAMVYTAVFDMVVMRDRSQVNMYPEWLQERIVPAADSWDNSTAQAYNDYAVPIFSTARAAADSFWTFLLFQIVLYSTIPVTRFIRRARDKLNSAGIARSKEQRAIRSAYDLGMVEPRYGAQMVVSPGTLSYLFQPPRRFLASTRGERFTTVVQTTPMIALAMLGATAVLDFGPNGAGFDATKAALLLAIPAKQVFLRVAHASLNASAMTHNRLTEFYPTAAQTRLQFNMTMGLCSVFEPYHLQAVPHATGGRAMIVASNLYGEKAYLTWIRSLSGKWGSRGYDRDLAYEEPFCVVRKVGKLTFLGYLLRLALYRHAEQQAHPSWLAGIPRLLVQGSSFEPLFPGQVGLWRDMEHFGSIHKRHRIENWGYLVRNPYAKNKFEPRGEVTQDAILRCALASLQKLAMDCASMAGSELFAMSALKPVIEGDDGHMGSSFVQRHGWNLTTKGSSVLEPWMKPASRIFYQADGYRDFMKDVWVPDTRKNAQLADDIQRRVVMWCTLLDVTILPFLLLCRVTGPVLGDRAAWSQVEKDVNNRTEFYRALQDWYWKIPGKINPHTEWPEMELDMSLGFSAFNNFVVKEKRTHPKDQRQAIIMEMLDRRLILLNNLDLLERDDALTNSAFVVTSLMRQVLMASQTMVTDLHDKAVFEEAFDVCFMTSRHQNSKARIEARRKELAVLLHVPQKSARTGEPLWNPTVINDLNNYTQNRRGEGGPFGPNAAYPMAYALVMYPRAYAFAHVQPHLASLATCLRTIYTAGYIALREVAVFADPKEREEECKFFLDAFKLDYEDLNITYNSALSLPAPSNLE